MDLVAVLIEAVNAGHLSPEHRRMAQEALPSDNTGVRAIAAWNVEMFGDLSEYDQDDLLFLLNW